MGTEIAVLKYYSVSKRGTTAKSNPKQATDPISLHTKFGDNSSNTFPLNERKPCVTPDIGRRISDGGKSKNNISTPRGVDITRGMLLLTKAKRPLKFKMLCGFNKHAVKLRMHKAAPYAFPIPLNTF